MKSNPDNVLDGPWGGAKGGFPIPGGMWKDVIGMMFVMPILVEAIYTIARGNVDDPQALAAEIVSVLEDKHDEKDI